MGLHIISFPLCKVGGYPPNSTDEKTQGQSRVFDQAKRRMCVRVNKHVALGVGRRGVVWGILRVRSAKLSSVC